MARLSGRHIKDAVEESLQEMDDRRSGRASRGLKTGWGLLDSQMGGGIQHSSNYIIAGLSGSGKSTLSNIIETNVIENNLDEDIIILNFNFETPSQMNVIKKYSADVDMTVHELMSSEDLLSDERFNLVKEKAQRYKDFPIYYFDVSGTADDVADTVLACRNEYPEKKILCILDHTRLVQKKSGDDEIQLVTELAIMSIRIKKITKCSFLFLGQLNSNIEKEARLLNPSMHVPMRSDLFGGKAVYDAMDNVFFAHRPDQLNLMEYTTRGLPTKDMMYFHVKKNRYGKLSTIQMDCSRIGFNKITEIELI